MFVESVQTSHCHIAYSSYVESSTQKLVVIPQIYLLSRYHKLQAGRVEYQVYRRCSGLNTSPQSTEACRGKGCGV